MGASCQEQRQKRNSHRKVQNDGVSTLLVEGCRQPPVLDLDRSPQRPRSRAPGREPAVPNPELVPPNHELLHLLRHRLRSPLLHGQAPDAQDASGLDAPRLWTYGLSSLDRRYIFIRFILTDKSWSRNFVLHTLLEFS